MSESLIEYFRIMHIPRILQQEMREGKLVNFGLKRINQSEIRAYLIEGSIHVQTNHVISQAMSADEQTTS